MTKFPARVQLPAVKAILQQLLGGSFGDTELDVVKQDFAIVDIYFETLSVKVCNILSKRGVLVELTAVPSLVVLASCLI